MYAGMHRRVLRCNLVVEFVHKAGRRMMLEPMKKLQNKRERIVWCVPACASDYAMYCVGRTKAKTIEFIYLSEWRINKLTIHRHTQENEKKNTRRKELYIRIHLHSIDDAYLCLMRICNFTCISYQFN